MKNSLKSLLIILVFPMAAETASAQDKKSVGKYEYYPLAVNTRWEYVTTKGVKISTQVTKHEEVNGVMCARVEATLGGTKKSSEFIRITDDGVYRHQAADQIIDPPLCFVKRPFKDKDTWKVDSKTLALPLTGEFTMTKGTVKVPAGEYKDVLICSSKDFKIADKTVEHTYWFAKNIGMVKQVVKFGNQTMTLELERYTPGTN